MRAPLAYLVSYLLSLLGNSIAAVALPLIVLQSTGSALGAGTVAAATAVPAVIVGLLAGVVIDRINRLTSSVVTDLISAAAIAALPIVDLVSRLSLGWFVLFGILGSLGDVPGMTARETLLPAIVRHGRLSAERLVGLRESLGAVTFLLGPALAGILVSVFNGATVLWITAATSAAAALVTLLIPRAVGRVPVGDPPPPVSLRQVAVELRDGATALFRSPFLVSITVIGLVSALILAALQVLVLPVYFVGLGSPGLLGFVLTALALGILLGGTAYAIAGTRAPRRVWFVTGLVVSTVGIAVLVTLASPPIVFLGAALLGLGSGLLSGPLGVLTIERVPESLRGRILSTQNALTTGAPALGILATGVLVETTTAGVAALAVGAVWLVALAVAVSAPSLRSLEPEDGTGVVTDAQ